MKQLFKRIRLACLVLTKKYYIVYTCDDSASEYGCYCMMKHVLHCSQYGEQGIKEELAVMEAEKIING